MMIDVEALGKAPNAVVTQIAAAVFDPEKRTIVREFNVHVNIDSSIRHGCTVDKSTLMWWMGQPHNARQVMIQGQQGARNLPAALVELQKFVRMFELSAVWAHRMVFDFGKLDWLYHNVQRGGVPWDFKLQRDTVSTMEPFGASLRKYAAPYQRRAHDASDDARAQAMGLMDFFHDHGDLS